MSTHLLPVHRTGPNWASGIRDWLAGQVGGEVTGAMFLVGTGLGYDIQILGLEDEGGWRKMIHTPFMSEPSPWVRTSLCHSDLLLHRLKSDWAVRRVDEFSALDARAGRLCWLFVASAGGRDWMALQSNLDRRSDLDVMLSSLLKDW